MIWHLHKPSCICRKALCGLLEQLWQSILARMIGFTNHVESVRRRLKHQLEIDTSVESVATLTEVHR
ncbi:uncharacterized protein DS421_5g143240 [Arachis hypogaea]|nr:uncharacterized protein DS421_5g143240 [Arachis hypogaea]